MNKLKEFKDRDEFTFFMSSLKNNNYTLKEVHIYTDGGGNKNYKVWYE